MEGNEHQDLGASPHMNRAGGTKDPASKLAPHKPAFMAAEGPGWAPAGWNAPPNTPADPTSPQASPQRAPLTPFNLGEMPAELAVLAEQLRAERDRVDAASSRSEKLEGELSKALSQNAELRASLTAKTEAVARLEREVERWAALAKPRA